MTKTKKKISKPKKTPIHISVPLRGTNAPACGAPKRQKSYSTDNFLGGKTPPFSWGTICEKCRVELMRLAENSIVGGYYKSVISRVAGLSRQPKLNKIFPKFFRGALVKIRLSMTEPESEMIGPFVVEGIRYFKQEPSGWFYDVAYAPNGTFSTGNWTHVNVEEAVLVLAPASEGPSFAGREKIDPAYAERQQTDDHHLLKPVHDELRGLHERLNEISEKLEKLLHASIPAPVEIVKIPEVAKPAAPMPPAEDNEPLPDRRAPHGGFFRLGTVTDINPGSLLSEEAKEQAAKKGEE